MIEAIIWRYRTGSLWRDLPEEFGLCQTVEQVSIQLLHLLGVNLAAQAE